MITEHITKKGYRRETDRSIVGKQSLDSDYMQNGPVRFGLAWET